MYLDLDLDTLIEHLVPPPELHLLIGLVSLLSNFLLDTWQGFDDWLKSINIIQQGYQGRGWDGNNSNKILENLDSLETNVTIIYMFNFKCSVFKKVSKCKKLLFFL